MKTGLLTIVLQLHDSHLTSVKYQVWWK